MERLFQAERSTRDFMNREGTCSMEDQSIWFPHGRAPAAAHLIHGDFGTFSNLLKRELPVVGWSGECHLQPRKTRVKNTLDIIIIIIA